MAETGGSGDGEGSTTRKTLEVAGIRDEAEFLGYSKMGLLMIFSPAIASFTHVVFYAEGGNWVWGMAGTILFGLLGLATVAATPDDETLLEFVSKYVRFWTRQTPYIHERRRHRPRPPKEAALKYARGRGRTRVRQRPSASMNESQRDQEDTQE